MNLWILFKSVLAGFPWHHSGRERRGPSSLLATRCCRSSSSSYPLGLCRYLRRGIPHYCWASVGSPAPHVFSIWPCDQWAMSRALSLLGLLQCYPKGTREILQYYWVKVEVQAPTWSTLRPVVMVFVGCWFLQLQVLGTWSKRNPREITVMSFLGSWGPELVCLLLSTVQSLLMFGWPIMSRDFSST